jgi:hypothetical protein
MESSKSHLEVRCPEIATVGTTLVHQGCPMHTVGEPNVFKRLSFSPLQLYNSLGIQTEEVTKKISRIQTDIYSRGSSKRW